MVGYLISSRHDTGRAPKGCPKLASEASKGHPKGPRDPDHGPRQLLRASSGPSAREVRPPKRAQGSPRSPRTGPKTAPKGPKIGSRSRSEAWTARLRTKKRKSCSRLGGSTIFEGRPAPKRAPSRPDLGPKSAKKAHRAEDSAKTVAQSADRPEIRPRTADGRLEEGSQLTGPRTTSEVKIDPSGQPCVRSPPSIHPLTLRPSPTLPTQHADLHVQWFLPACCVWCSGSASGEPQDSTKH